MSAPAGDEDANGSSDHDKDDNCSSDYDEDDNCDRDNGGNDNCISDYDADDNGNSDYDEDDDPEVVTMTKPGGRAAPELLLQFVPTLYTSPTPLSGSIKEISSKIEIPNTRKHAKFTSLDDIITITTVIIIIIVLVCARNTYGTNTYRYSFCRHSFRVSLSSSSSSSSTDK